MEKQQLGDQQKSEAERSFLSTPPAESPWLSTQSFLLPVAGLQRNTASGLSPRLMWPYLTDRLQTRAREQPFCIMSLSPCASGCAFSQILEQKEREKDSDLRGRFFCLKFWRSREGLFAGREKNEVEMQRWKKRISMTSVPGSCPTYTSAVRLHETLWVLMTNFSSFNSANSTPIH